VSLYSILDSNARGWWYHRQLRADGNNCEARRRERESIRSSVRTLRSALKWDSVVVVGYGGTRVQYRSRCLGQDSALSESCLSSISGGMDSYMVRAALLLGLPVLDLTALGEVELAPWVYRGPLLHLNPAAVQLAGIPSEIPESGISLSYCDRDYYLTYWAAAGAKIYNLPESLAACRVGACPGRVCRCAVEYDRERGAVDAGCPLDDCEVCQGSGNACQCFECRESVEIWAAPAGPAGGAP
jgi:hypothetical protein